MPHVQKEFDIYGNLILRIWLNKWSELPIVRHMENRSYLGYQLKKNVGNTNIISSGLSESMMYDEKNMIVRHELIEFSTRIKRCIKHYAYTYSDSGLLTCETKAEVSTPLKGKNEDIKYFDQYFINHKKYKYDKYNNLSEIAEYIFQAPLDTDISNITPDENDLASKDFYENIYNEHGHLSEVYHSYGNFHADDYFFVYRPKPQTTEPVIYKYETYEGVTCKYFFETGEKDLIYRMKYDDNGQLIYKEEHGYLDWLKLKNAENSDINPIYIYRYIYKDGILYEEEQYSTDEKLLKVIRYETINGRQCKKTLSPARDDLKWHLTVFHNNEIVFEIDEEVVTKEVLAAAAEYIISNFDRDNIPKCIYFYNSDASDCTMYKDELNETVEYYKNNYGFIIEFYYLYDMSVEWGWDY